MRAFGTFTAIAQAFTGKKLIQTYADSFNSKDPSTKKRGLSAKAKAFFGEGIAGLVPVTVKHVPGDTHAR